MLRILNVIFCILSVAYATVDFSDLCLCTNGYEEEPVQNLYRTKVCVPLYSSDKSLEELTQSRRKRSAEDPQESWPLYRFSRGQETVKTIQFPSSFTPRLGRRGAGGRIIGDPTQHVINLNAGTAFTPRLGRRV